MKVSEKWEGLDYKKFILGMMQMSQIVVMFTQVRKYTKKTSNYTFSKGETLLAYK